MEDSHADKNEIISEVEKSIGSLEESSEQLADELEHAGDLDPEETGKWITAIKALLAIIKP